MQTTKQRGSGWSIKLVFNLYRLFGYKFIYYLMFPVTFFYFLFATNIRKSLKIYYKNIGIKFTNLVYFEHLRLFAVTMVDRFIIKVSPDSYNFIYENDDASDVLKSGTILIQSHFGGWASSSNASKTKNKIHIVMQETLMDSIRSVEKEMDVKSNISIIDINEGAIAVSVSIANALIANEIVAIMGDRASNIKSIVKTQFFQKTASFNKNPFQIAYKMNKPILVYFILHIGMQRYKIEYIRIDMDQSKSDVEAIEEGVLKYVEKYENIIKRYPNQWLNFFDFWK